jgi:tetratricopeptide (TPR) repeat protein
METQEDQILELARQIWAGELEPDRLDGEFGHIEAALSWSLQHEPERGLEIAADLRAFWGSTGRFDAGREWLWKLLAQTADGPRDTLRARALSTAAVLAFRQGDNAEAQRLSAEALEIAREANDPDRIVDALVGLCRVGLRDNDPDRVRRLSGEGREVARTAGNRTLEKLPLHCLAEATRMAGDYGEARRLYQESIALNQELGDQHMVSVELSNLAAVELHDRHLDEATRLWQESLRRSFAANDLYLLPYCVMGLGEVAVASEQYRRGAQLLGAATGIFSSTGQVIDPADAAVYEESVNRARDALGERFTALWHRGSESSVEEAVAAALSAGEEPPIGLSDEIAAMDRSLWQAAKEGRLDDFRSLLADGYQAIYGRGLVTADEDIEATGKMDIRSFHLENMRVRELAPGVALSTYLTVLDASASGRDISGNLWGASVWKKLNDRWKLVYHSETRMA